MTNPGIVHHREGFETSCGALAQQHNSTVDRNMVTCPDCNAGPKIGDRVRITLPDGWWAEGTVTGTEIFGGDVFSINIQRDKVAYKLPGFDVFGPGRWKASDGGHYTIL